MGGGRGKRQKLPMTAREQLVEARRFCPETGTEPGQKVMGHDLRAWRGKLDWANGNGSLSVGVGVSSHKKPRNTVSRGPTVGGGE